MGDVLVVEADPRARVAFGVSRPAMIRSSVVLPEPLGPSSATSSPSLNRQAHVAQRLVAAERLADV